MASAVRKARKLIRNTQLFSRGTRSKTVPKRTLLESGVFLYEFPDLEGSLEGDVVPCLDHGKKPTCAVVRLIRSWGGLPEREPESNCLRIVICVAAPHSRTRIGASAALVHATLDATASRFAGSSANKTPPITMKTITSLKSLWTP